MRLKLIRSTTVVANVRSQPHWKIWKWQIKKARTICFQILIFVESNGIGYNRTFRVLVFVLPVWRCQKTCSGCSLPTKEFSVKRKVFDWHTSWRDPPITLFLPSCKSCIVGSSGIFLVQLTPTACKHCEFSSRCCKLVWIEFKLSIFLSPTCLSLLNSWLL